MFALFEKTNGLGQEMQKIGCIIDYDYFEYIVVSNSSKTQKAY